MRPAVLLFAKAPIPGRVKTRLEPSLTPEEAATLHEAFVRDALAMLAGTTPESDIALYTDTATDAWADVEVARALQVEGDLGARMLAAIEAGLAAGRPRVTIVGSDAPTLPPEHLKRLWMTDVDVALGPTDDGGYYAISCRRTHPEMFRGVAWSAARTLTDTVRACEACGLNVAVGPSWYDIDTPDDLRRLAREPVLPPHTGRWFAKQAGY
jgi:rSAM/selenodomain-associated transferase 1